MGPSMPGGTIPVRAVESGRERGGGGEAHGNREEEEEAWILQGVDLLLAGVGPRISGAWGEGRAGSQRRLELRQDQGGEEDGGRHPAPNIWQTLTSDAAWLGPPRMACTERARPRSVLVNFPAR